MATQIVPAAEFQALPLEFIISAPLVGAVKAQAMAAQTTLDFINGMIQKPDGGAPGGGAAPAGSVRTVDFQIKVKENDAQGNPQPKEKTISVPMLSIVPIPYLRIDSLTVNFKYEIRQTVTDTDATDKSISMDFQTGGLLSKWVSGGLKGGVSTKSSEESTINRSGSLEITVHASEAPIPEGLAKVLSMLSSGI